MANHIASISSSSRKHHEPLESSRQDTTQAESASVISQENTTFDLSTTGGLAQLSLFSLSDDDSVASKPSVRSSVRGQRRSSEGNSKIKNDLFSSKLEQLDSTDDIDSHIANTDLYHCNVLTRMEQKWLEISKNLENTMLHLKDCSQQVTESSANCLDALSKSVVTTCDSVDDELKAFYHLMTKCDELTTKLSIATSFRDEIKTLRKSIETLEQLYKNRPQARATVRVGYRN